METSNNTSVEARHSDVSYERRDLNHRAVFLTLAILGLAGLLIHIAVWGLFETFGGSQYASHQTTNPIMTSDEELREVGGDPAVTFPMPRLQPDPTADLNKFRVREEEQLNSYGWVDQAAGKIHIPIERAIDTLGSSWPKDQQMATPEAGPVNPQSNKTGDETKTPQPQR